LIRDLPITERIPSAHAQAQTHTDKLTNAQTDTHSEQWTRSERWSDRSQHFSPHFTKKWMDKCHATRR